MSFLKRHERFFWPLVIFYRLFLKNDSFLRSSGWLMSARLGKPVDASGNYVPWMNHAAIEFLSERLGNDMRLFEYGSGYSTLYFARLVGQVHSVEYDLGWLATIRKDIPQNATVSFVEYDPANGTYSQSIHASGEQYDVVVVDGRDRVRCMREAVQAVSPDGVVILGDSQRDKYREAHSYMREHGFKSLHFSGLTSLGCNTERSTVFYRAENCFDL